MLSVNLMRNFCVSTRNSFSFMCLCCVSVYTMAASNPIQIENAKMGSSAWDDFGFPSNPHDMEGYANKDSVNIGESIKLYVNANPRVDPSYSLIVYRLGWYGGLGARKVTGAIVRTSIRQVIPKPDPVTGMVQANWVMPYTLGIPKSWISGIYVVSVIGNTSKKGQYIPFIVRDVNRASNYLFQSSTTTWQAYNAWGGKSLYEYNSNTLPVKSDTHPVQDALVPARKVSFNRPYDDWIGLGDLPNWEINMLFFLEHEGYDVTYQTDMDTHTGNEGLLNHKAVLSVGHDEYWSKAIRDNFEFAREHGIGLGFFGANAAFWQIRMESAVAPLSGQKNRTIVAYKGNAETEDPLAKNLITSDDHLVTALWRDSRWANRPENALIGIMFGFWPVNAAVVTAKSDSKLANGTPSHWVYAGTAVKVGDSFAGLLGYETDRIFNNGKTPANLTILAASSVPTTSIQYPQFPHDSLDQPKAHMTLYTKKCTATPCKNPVSTVFAAGSMQWIWGLDSYAKFVNHENTAVKKITRNVLARLINAPLPI